MLGVSALLSSAGSSILGAANFGMNLQNNLWNQKFTEQQAQQNQQNIETQWNREDTAYQRTLADLEASGLNKSLAIGNGSSTSSTGATGQGSGASQVQGMNELGQLADMFQRAQDINNQNRQVTANIAKIESDIASNVSSNKERDANIRKILSQYEQNQHDLDLNRSGNTRSGDSTNAIFNSVKQFLGSDIPKNTGNSTTMNDYTNGFGQ